MHLTAPLSPSSQALGNRIGRLNLRLGPEAAALSLFSHRSSPTARFGDEWEVRSMEDNSADDVKRCHVIHHHDHLSALPLFFHHTPHSVSRTFQSRLADQRHRDTDITHSLTSPAISPTPLVVRSRRNTPTDHICLRQTTVSAALHCLVADKYFQPAPHKPICTHPGENRAASCMSRAVPTTQGPSAL